MMENSDMQRIVLALAASVIWAATAPPSSASASQPTPARIGAIDVMPNHVGIVAFVGDDYVILVSGNHGGSSGYRSVGLGRYAMSRITTFRMPLVREMIMADEPKLSPAMTR